MINQEKYNNQTLHLSLGNMTMSVVRKERANAVAAVVVVKMEYFR
jgi:hypothetical protein